MGAFKAVEAAISKSSGGSRVVPFENQTIAYALHEGKKKFIFMSRRQSHEPEAVQLGKVAQIIFAVKTTLIISTSKRDNEKKKRLLRYVVGMQACKYCICKKFGGGEIPPFPKQFKNLQLSTRRLRPTGLILPRPTYRRILAARIDSRGCAAYDRSPRHESNKVL
ncbi:hypothetical protein GcC1_218039, partial [Golovinomyces cichoracearum]